LSRDYVLLYGRTLSFLRFKEEVAEALEMAMELVKRILEEMK